MALKASMSFVIGYHHEGGRDVLLEYNGLEKQEHSIHKESICSGGYKENGKLTKGMSMSPENKCGKICIKPQCLGL